MQLKFHREEEERKTGIIFSKKYTVYKSKYIIKLENDELEDFEKLLIEDNDVLNNSKIQSMHGGLRAKYLISVFYAYRNPEKGYSVSGGSIEGGEFSYEFSGSFLWNVCKNCRSKGEFFASSVFGKSQHRAVWEEDIKERLSELKRKVEYAKNFDNEPSEETVDL